MTKARDLGKLVSQGQLLADGVVQASEISGLASVATTGSYVDLTNKPTIPTLPTLATVATTGSYADLANKPTIPTVPTLATVATTGSYNDLTNKPTNLGGGVTDYNDLTNKPTLATVATTGSYTDLTNKPTLATVATTGSYTDLTNKPTIPTLPTLATVATTGSYTDLTNKPTIIDSGIIKQNPNSISTNQTIAAGSNGQSVGPITIDTGVTVTLGDGQRWAVH